MQQWQQQQQQESLSLTQSQWQLLIQGQEEQQQQSQAQHDQQQHCVDSSADQLEQGHQRQWQQQMVDKGPVIKTKQQQQQQQEGQQEMLTSKQHQRQPFVPQVQHHHQQQEELQGDVSDNEQQQHQGQLQEQLELFHEARSYQEQYQQQQQQHRQQLQQLEQSDNQQQQLLSEPNSFERQHQQQQHQNQQQRYQQQQQQQLELSTLLAQPSLPWQEAFLSQVVTPEVYAHPTSCTALVKLLALWQLPRRLAKPYLASCLSSFLSDPGRFSPRQLAILSAGLGLLGVQPSERLVQGLVQVRGEGVFREVASLGECWGFRGC